MAANKKQQNTGVRITPITMTSIIHYFINPRGHKPKIFTRRHKGAGRGEGGGSRSIGPLPCTFDTIHSINLIFGTYIKLSLYFQTIIFTWCLIGFHGNYNHMNNAISGRHLGYSSFRVFFHILIEHQKW